MYRPWDDFLKQAAQTCGLPLDQFKYTTALLLGIPLGYFLRYSTKDPWRCSDAEKASAISTRHMLCAIIGLMEVVYVFGWETFHSFFSTTVAYILLQVAPRDKVHLWVTAWAMGYMSCAHIYRMIVDFGGWSIDFTTPQLLVTQKLMNIAFSLYDGSRDAKKLTEEQSKRKLTACPSVMEMFGYVFCIHTLLAGPATDYNDYLTWIDGSKLAGKKPKPTSAILLRIVGAIGCAIAFSVVLPYCNIDGHGDGSYLSTKSFLYVLLWNNFSFCLLRHRYYFAWVLGDAGCNAAGFGYNGEDKNGKQKWDGVLNVDYFAVEFAPNFRSAMNGEIFSCFRNTATFGMSAVWHGFYPGYYFTFISCALFNEVARLLRRHVRPLVIPTKEAEKSLNATLYHISSSVLLLTFQKSINYWSYWYFAPHVVALLLYIAVPIVFKQPKDAKKMQ
ncbi:hypothetical protein GUITHDRAFT_109777 [Guillardia theta CCMP2712]|uniref:Uncharacterized protein n=1 Tax=Guillardia theta (strain CCMP2712) TaxID=905079 RepID=L1J7P3_GUITC|nr:hypothetical protein GUITHDRAFT_109777 [Guillardia theta CCMP2712]EKX44327.1 hypothetical protein GUITHDRAFT_109777 [Guillardia theta CCMP2712]|eukprot:XP_005831307.1 hypothetical protein GUITHDRAFT_109777 [Guillardia theta CCMP2712]